MAVRTPWAKFILPMPVLPRMVGLFFVGLVMRLWEEGRFFVELITEQLHFTTNSRHFGEIVTAAYVLVIAFVPLFPRVTPWPP